MAKRRFEASDIPLKDRLLMRKFQTIAEHRDDAARNALKIACVALNNVEGLGYTRLARFAKEVQKLTTEYYEDPEYWEVKLRQRLVQMGFVVSDDGHLYGAEDNEGNTVPTKLLEDQRKQ